jgi:peptidoglycan pentaglycine glycine transferase (the first glycine)
MRTLMVTGRDGLQPDAWDRRVACDPRGHLLQTWAWGELKREFGWTPVRIAVSAGRGEDEQDVLAGAQVLYRHLGPVSMGYVPKGPWCIQEASAGPPAALQALWQAIHSVSRRMRAIALKVEPEWYDQERERHTWLTGQGFRPADPVQPRRTLVVDLTADEEEILMRMKSKWRYNVRLSMRRGVEVTAQPIDAIDAFYRLMTITGERDEFGVHSQAYYRRALALLRPLGRAQLFMAHYEGQPLAGLMAFAFDHRAYYMYGASSNVHRELMPNHQLQWRAMQWAKERGCTEYDLWGITDRDPDEETENGSAALGGVERFKAGFGGDTVRTVGAYDRVYVRPLYWLYGRLRHHMASWV